jgi:DNA polymerase elongation subunit (family B)
MEADIGKNLCKRYLLDKVSIDKADLRWVMFDIETQSKDMPDPLYAPDPISCITTYDNYTKEYKQFWTKDYLTEMELVDAFITYIRSISLDLMIAYNAKGFDYPYMCYSGDTEVLTEEGWKLIKNIVNNKEKIKIATLNPKNNEVIYHYPTEYIKYKYNGKMFFQNSNRINLLVTPNHQLWGNTSKIKNFRFIQADQSPRMLRYQKYVPKSTKNDEKWFILPGTKLIWRKLRKEKKYPMNLWLKFLGWYLTEGWLQNNNNRGIIICQTKKHNPINCLLIEKILIRLGIKAKCYLEKNYVFSNTQIYQYLNQFGKSDTKFIPRDILDKLSTRQCKLLLKTLLRGDGHKIGFNKYSYSTISRGLADNVQELGIKSGFITTIHKYGKSYSLCIGKQELYHTPNRINDNRKMIDYNSDVYCIEVPNHIIYVRREINKEVWCGNCTRIPDFACKLSSIGKIVKRSGFPAGISILDYYELVKKVYKFKKYKLEYVYCTEFKKEYKPEKYSFGIITEKIKDKNLNDVKMLVELEDKFHLINYFDELRRIGKVLWDDLCMNSVIVDGFILQTAKEKGVVLPSKPDEAEKFRRTEEDEIKGGYVFAKTGLHKNVPLFDVGGTYPNLIITFNLDPVNVKKEPNTQTIAIRKVNIWQNSNAIVPTVCTKLVHAREEIQKQVEILSGDEKALMKQKDAAHKGVNNTVYGTLLFKSSRMYNKDIASTITYLARFLIRYTKLRLKTFGYETVASDTDSIFVKTVEQAEIIQSIINEQIIPEFLQHFGKEKGTLKFKYEGTFSKLFILTKKHYIGYMIGKDEPIIKGVEALRSDSSKFTEKFQEELLKMILDEKPKEEVDTWLLAEDKRMRSLPLLEVAFPVKLNGSVESYKVETIHLRSLRYALAEHPDWQVGIGQDFYYTFIIPDKFEIKRANRKVKKTKKELAAEPNGELTKIKVVEVKKAINVMAFDEFLGIGEHKPDWDELAKRNIWKKAANIYAAMHWELPIELKKEDTESEE